MLSMIAAFRHRISPRENADSIAELLTRPALGALTRMWFQVKDKERQHAEVARATLAAYLATPEAHVVGMDSGRTGELRAKAMIDVSLPYEPAPENVASLRTYVVLPYEVEAAQAVTETVLALAEVLQPVWGMLSVEPSFGIAENAALAKGPPKDERPGYPWMTDARIRYRRAPWYFDNEIDQVIGGPEWGTLLGPKHLEKLTLEALRSSGAFFEVRSLSYGGAFLRLSEDPLDTQAERILGLVEKAREALAPVTVDVSAVKL